MKRALASRSADSLSSRGDAARQGARLQRMTSAPSLPDSERGQVTVIFGAERATESLSKTRRCENALHADRALLIDPRRNRAARYDELARSSHTRGVRFRKALNESMRNLASRNRHETRTHTGSCCRNGATFRDHDTMRPPSSRATWPGWTTTKGQWVSLRRPSASGCERGSARSRPQRDETNASGRFRFVPRVELALRAPCRLSPGFERLSTA